MKNCIGKLLKSSAGLVHRPFPSWSNYFDTTTTPFVALLLTPALISHPIQNRFNRRYDAH